MLMDIYALASERSAAVVERFLARFLPRHDRTSDDYTVRVDGSELERVIDTPEELTAFCEAEPRADARAYWRNQADEDPHSAHVFFLPDGGLVLGLSVAARDEAVWDRWLERLKSFAGAKYGYYTGECPPEDTIAEFVAASRWGR